MTTPESTLRKAQEAVDGLNRLKLLVAHRLDTETVREISTLANAGIAAVRALAAQAGDGEAVAQTDLLTDAERAAIEWLEKYCDQYRDRVPLVCAAARRLAAGVAVTESRVRCFNDAEWFREFKVEGVTFLAPLIQQDHARRLLGRSPLVPATQPREQAGTKFGKPLDKPARVGATVFRVGVGSDLVVQRAQREYEYHLNPPPYDKAVLQAALAAAQCTCAQTPGAGCSNCPPDAAPCPRAEGVDEAMVERFASKYWGSDWGTAHGCHTAGQMSHERANIRDALRAALGGAK